MISLRVIVLGTAALALSAGVTAAQLGGGPGRGVQLQIQPNGPAGNPLLQQLLGGNGGGQFRGRGGRGGGFGGGGGRGGRGFGGEYLTGNEPIDILLDRNGIAVWDTDAQFKKDVFTFVRLRFTSAGRGGFGGGAGGGTGGTGKSWLNDWPDGDIDVSFRLQQMTSMKVDPVPLRLQIYDDRLLNYPFALMNQVGALQFTDREIVALRRYLLSGGFIMVDDHWGRNDHDNFAQQLKRVFPDRDEVELTLDHPIFHDVFDFKKLPQVPTEQFWARDAAAGNPDQTSRPPEYPPPIYRALYDDHGRMMLIEDCNTDTTDGWQREGESEEYFHRFSEKIAYPWVINVIFYAMTH